VRLTFLLFMLAAVQRPPGLIHGPSRIKVGDVTWYTVSGRDVAWSAQGAELKASGPLASVTAMKPGSVQLAVTVDGKSSSRTIEAYDWTAVPGGVSLTADSGAGKLLIVCHDSVLQISSGKSLNYSLDDSRVLQWRPGSNAQAVELLQGIAIAQVMTIDGDRFRVSGFGARLPAILAACP
jgi:hypothetical protein